MSPIALIAFALGLAVVAAIGAVIAMKPRIRLRGDAQTINAIRVVDGEAEFSMGADQRALSVYICYVRKMREKAARNA